MDVEKSYMLGIKYPHSRVRDISQVEVHQKQVELINLSSLVKFSALTLFFFFQSHMLSWIRFTLSQLKIIIIL